MPRPAFWMVAIFVIALGAGLLAGHSFFPSAPKMPPPPPGGGPDGERSFLKKELNLTDEQADKIRGIWSELLKNGPRQHGDARRALQKERDDAVVALLTPEQKKEYDKIIAKFNDRMNQMNKEREAAFQQAVEKTKTILNDEQRKKFDEINEALAKKGFHGPPWGRPGGPDRGPERGPGGPGGPEGPGGPRPEPTTNRENAK